MRRRLCLVAGFIWLTVFSVVIAARAQSTLVFNGDFESRSLGWTMVRGAHVSIAGGLHGLACFLASTNASPSTEPMASQSISGFQPGFTYLVSGDYWSRKDRGGNSPTNASFGVAFDGVYRLQIAAIPNGNWQSFSFLYTPSSISALLSLSSQINGTGVEYYIDNIVIQTVPEPSSAILLGLGGCWLIRHCRRRRTLR